MRFYMWEGLTRQFGLFWGSKTAQNMCLSILGWPQGHLRENIFLALFRPPFDPKMGYLKGCGAEWSLKMATNSLKMGLECALDVFGHFWTPFRSPNGPFEGLLGTDQPENVSSSTPRGLGRFVFGKTQFRPVSDTIDEANKAIPEDLWSGIDANRTNGLPCGRQALPMRRFVRCPSHSVTWPLYRLPFSMRFVASPVNSRRSDYVQYP